jgi:leucyl-tRNA synthetase
MKIMFQVNGKLRGEANVSIHISEEEVIELAKSNIGVLKFIEDKRIVKEIYVPGKIVNIVAK